MTSLFENDYADKVERYNWFTTYASGELGFGSGALNIPNWEYVGEGVGCPESGKFFLYVTCYFENCFAAANAQNCSCSPLLRVGIQYKANIQLGY